MNTDRLFRSIPMNEYPNIIFYAGTEDKDKLKSCFLEIKGTFETTNEERLKTFNSVCRKISQTINQALDKELFREEFILNKSVADTFVKLGKSYIKLEYTVFPKRPTTFSELTKELNNITNRIWNDNIQDTDDYRFHKQMLTKRRYAKKS